MAILDRDIKLLWGRAAGRCSHCKVPVTENKHSVTDAFPFGENAHIIAERPGGPRGGEGLPDGLRNSYFNLILLCPNCHTKIDKAPEDFPPERLRQIKSDHEAEMARLYPRDKDSYDQFLEFSSVTEENWLSPDRKSYMPLGVTQEQWIGPFLGPRLGTSVPRNVIRTFEVARACMIYSWFFYPLATVGLEQLLRVGKFAVRERCRQLQPDPADFALELKSLVAATAMSQADESRWAALDSLSSDRTFLAGRTLFDPGQAIDMLHTIAELINRLFSGQVTPR